MLVAPRLARRDSDAPVSPSLSSSDAEDLASSGYLNMGSPRNPTKRTRHVQTSPGVNGRGAAFGGSGMDDAYAEAEADAEQEVHSPGMEISFDLDSDPASPCISSDELDPPIIQATSLQTPHSPAHPYTHVAPKPNSSVPRFLPARPTPSPCASPSQSSGFHYAHQTHHGRQLPMSQPRSFAYAHAQRQRHGQRQAKSLETGDNAYASMPKEYMVAGPGLGAESSGQAYEQEGLLLSSPEFMLGSSGSSGSSIDPERGSRYRDRGQVPLPISISSESDMSGADDIPDTASTLRTARPRRYINNASSREKGKGRQKTRPPATASPSYRLGWRSRVAPPPVVQSRSCPALQACMQALVDDDDARWQTFGTQQSPNPSPATTMRDATAETMAMFPSEPSQTLRRALSTGSRSKRNTFGPCDIYDDAGGEYPGTSYSPSDISGSMCDQSTSLGPPSASHQQRPGYPSRSITDFYYRRNGHHLDSCEISASSHRTSRSCPSGPSSAHTSPFHGPIQLAEDLGALAQPGSVRMTPTPSLDEVVDVIRAAISEDETGHPKDGMDGPKDGMNGIRHDRVQGYTIQSGTTADSSPSSCVETATNADGWVRNVKGHVDGAGKDVSIVYAHGNDSPILPHDPLPPISSFTPSTPPPLHAAVLTPGSPHVALDATAASLDDSPIHSTSVNNTRPPSTSSSSSAAPPFSALGTRAQQTPSPVHGTSLDSISLLTPLDPPRSRSPIPQSHKGEIGGPSDREKPSPIADGQHTPDTVPRLLPTTPQAGSRVSVLFPTPPPQFALPPTPASAPLDRPSSFSRASKRLSYQASPGPSTRRSLTVASSSTQSDRGSPTFEPDRLLPPASPSGRCRRPVSSYTVSSEAGESHQAEVDPANMALQVNYRNNHNMMSRPGHLKQPSVPYSTRSSFSTSTVPLDAPHNYFNRASVQSTSTAASRPGRSRYTASASSGSSIYSSDSEAGRVYRAVVERPEISTVFEEDGSFEVGPSSAGEYEASKVRRKQSQSTLDSAHYIPSAQRHRAGTISSQYSGISDRSAHPFAASASRSIERNMSGLLSAQTPALQSSRSSPNLRAMAKEGALAKHQVTLADSSDEDDDKCPVCIESLNASFKLPGEKPHIVPECGHALHEECFTHVYGDVPSSGSTRNVGLCGVCRQPIKIVVGGGDKKKKGKFAAMTGQGSGLQGGSSTSINSSSGASVSSNLQANDPVVPAAGGSPKRSGLDSTPRVIIPSISVRPETTTMNKQKRQLAAMVTVHVPGAGERERYPRPNRSRSEASLSPALPPSPISTSSMDGMLLNASGVGATLPLDAVQADLERRLQDFGKSSLESCGPLRLYDLLDVRKGDSKRPFLMYLFSDTLACISEETPSALSKMFKSGGTLRASKSTRSMKTAAATKTTLKLRGRIHFKHVRKVIDSSTANELSLTILMIDENHQTFILSFRDRKHYDLWKNMLDKVLKELRERGVSETGGNSASKVAKLMGTGAPVALRKANAAISPSSTVNSGMSGLGFGNFDAMSPAMSTFSGEQDTRTSYATPMQPLGPIHTPVDIVLVLAIPQNVSAPESAPLKLRLMRQALGFVLATFGPRDRISLVSCEQGVNVRRTPLLCTTRPDSRRRLEQFVENLGTGGAQEDECEVDFAPDERPDLVTAMNVSLDVLLQRKAKNPLSGLIVVSDTAEMVRAGQLELIFARLDSVNIPIHTIGYGKAHDPSPLWLLCNQSNGTYTFVREWYHLRDTLAGVIGGLMSIAMTRARISLSCTENDFRIARIMGVQTPIPAQGAKTIDIELRDLRFGETREILVELDYEGDGGNAEPSRPKTSLSATTSMDRLSLADSSSVVKDMVVAGRIADDVPAVEVDCSYHDPASGRTVSRLTQPILLTIPIASAPIVQPVNSRVLAFDPVVKRRRMEILGSDMIARALLLMTRQNANQAERLLLETRGVIVRLINTITNSLPQDRPAMSRKEMLAVQNAEMMQSVVDDLEMMAEAVLEQPQVFERDSRNMVTQQANILRTQRSWTTRSPTERMYCTDEVREFLQLSGEWTVRA